jgi:hypothetical protein
VRALADLIYFGNLQVSWSIGAGSGVYDKKRPDFTAEERLD